MFANQDDFWTSDDEEEDEINDNLINSMDVIHNSNDFCSLNNSGSLNSIGGVNNLSIGDFGNINSISNKGFNGNYIFSEAEDEFDIGVDYDDKYMISQAEEISLKICETLLTEDNIVDNDLSITNKVGMTSQNNSNEGNLIDEALSRGGKCSNSHDLNEEVKEKNSLNKDKEDAKADLSKKKQIRKKWSVEDNKDLNDFYDVLGYDPHLKKEYENNSSEYSYDVDNIVIMYPFELDDFQKRAVVNIHTGNHVLVAAHTSAGKTAIAEYAIELANKNGKKAIYTSPIKALSSQKYREFQIRFRDYPAHPTFTQRNRIGIITGDVSINSDAQCVIMTTEILRTMLYRNDPCIEQIQTVIFDEVHYINDAERGVVWEEVIILLDPKVQLVLLSATIPNYLEFANWIGKIKQNTVYCIKTLHRPVPLKHYLYIYENCFEVMDEYNKFNINGYKEMLDYIKLSKNKKSLSSLKNKVNKLSSCISNNKLNVDDNNTGIEVKKDNSDVKDVEVEENDCKRECEDNFNEAENEHENERERDKEENNIAMLKVPAVNKNYYNVSNETKFKTEVYRLQVFLKLLEKNDQLPVILFGFSRRKVEQFATSIPNLNFLYNHNEKSNIITFIKDSTSKLSEVDQKIPQLLQCRELALRGIGIHHSGMLPIIKEMTEILFTKGLIKVLFATETISMGINCPARSIVFTSIKKYDGRKNRILLSSEYTQMAGRAGRRGIDTFGNVFIFNSSHETIPECIDIVKMMLNTYLPVQSKFRLTYQMILQLSCRHSLRIEDMMTNSFKEMFRAINLPIFQKNLNRKVRKHSSIHKRINEILTENKNYYYFGGDDTQSGDNSTLFLNSMQNLINIVNNIYANSSMLFKNLLNSAVNKNIVMQKIFIPGRLFIFNTLSLMSKLPLFANIIEYNQSNTSFNIIVYSKDYVDFTNIKDNVHEYIQNLEGNTRKDNADDGGAGGNSNNYGNGDYYDVVEESIQLYKNTDKRRQINIVQNLISSDKRLKNNKKESSNNNSNDKHQIELIHYSPFNSNDSLFKNSFLNNFSSSSNQTANNGEDNIFDVNYYYVFRNVSYSFILYLLDYQIMNSGGDCNSKLFSNINYDDNTVLHNIAVKCRQNISEFLNSNDKDSNRNHNNGNNGVNNVNNKNELVGAKNNKSKKNKNIKLNLYDFMSKTEASSNNINNVSVNANNYHPKLFLISKVLKSIEIDYYDLLKKYNDSYNEYTNIYYDILIKYSNNKVINDIIPLIVESNKLENDINIYKHFIDDESLDDYPEMKLKIQLLIEHGFLESNLTITKKGRIASEILSNDELTLVEILLNGMLHKLNIHEITSLLSCFVFPEKMDNYSNFNCSNGGNTNNNGNTNNIIIDDRPSLPTIELLNAHDEMINIHKEYEKSHYLNHINLDTEQFWSLCNDKFMFIAYKWSNRESLKDIMEFIHNSQINLHEGTIVRTILRLDELVRKLIIASKMIGDNIIEEKLSLIHENISRDIIFMTSLYFNN
ncbi:mRNA translation inhibitor SKI2 SFII helicase [Cryptosporidium ryanae]|uniref:mRNA translation inhibitor SKI2 SFII helicase n=1 Tax=Cryptosporidium ryanae TaxID=515981 RepID=UPI00351A0007|nr:mRNA translation inhibitor SKI2 SFII helicase [Cryptosporidium ryanae]